MIDRRCQKCRLPPAGPGAAARTGRSQSGSIRTPLEPPTAARASALSSPISTCLRLVGKLAGGLTCHLQILRAARSADKRTSTSKNVANIPCAALNVSLAQTVAGNIETALVGLLQLGGFRRPFDFPLELLEIIQDTGGRLLHIVLRRRMVTPVRQLGTCWFTRGSRLKRTLDSTPSGNVTVYPDTDGRTSSSASSASRLSADYGANVQVAPAAPLVEVQDCGHGERKWDPQPSHSTYRHFVIMRQCLERLHRSACVDCENVAYQFVPAPRERKSLDGDFLVRHTDH